MDQYQHMQLAIYINKLLLSTCCCNRQCNLVEIMLPKKTFNLCLQFNWIRMLFLGVRFVAICVAPTWRSRCDVMVRVSTYSELKAPNQHGYHDMLWTYEPDKPRFQHFQTSLLTMLKMAITSMRAVVVMVRTSRSQGLLVTMKREEVGNQVREQKEPFLPCCECKEIAGMKIEREAVEKNILNKSQLQ